MRWLYKLEYKYGKKYIPNLMNYIVAGMAIVYAIGSFIDYTFFYDLMFFREAIFKGEIWRLVSFIFLPPSPNNSLLMLFSLYCYYMLGNLLQSTWGGFKLNIYYFIGILGSILSGLISPVGISTNSALNSSLFLAVAATMPDTEFRFFFVLPIKAKWLGIIYFLFEIPSIINAFSIGLLYGFSALIVLGFSLLNFFVFFGSNIVSTVKQQIIIYNNRRNWNNRNR